MSLSDKIIMKNAVGGGAIMEKDVKDFIKELKKKMIKNHKGCGKSCKEGFSDFFICGTSDKELCFDCEYPLINIIDKLAGENLI